LERYLELAGPDAEATVGPEIELLVAQLRQTLESGGSMQADLSERSAQSGIDRV